MALTFGSRSPKLVLRTKYSLANPRMFFDVTLQRLPSIVYSSAGAGIVAPPRVRAGPYNSRWCFPRVGPCLQKCSPWEWPDFFFFPPFHIWYCALFPSSTAPLRESNSWLPAPRYLNKQTCSGYTHCDGPTQQTSKGEHNRSLWTNTHGPWRVSRSQCKGHRDRHAEGNATCPLRVSSVAG